MKIYFFQILKTRELGQVKTVIGLDIDWNFWIDRWAGVPPEVVLEVVQEQEVAAGIPEVNGVNRDRTAARTRRNACLSGLPTFFTRHTTGTRHRHLRHPRRQSSPESGLSLTWPARSRTTRVLRSFLQRRQLRRRFMPPRLAN